MNPSAPRSANLDVDPDFSTAPAQLLVSGELARAASVDTTRVVPVDTTPLALVDTARVVPVDTAPPALVDIVLPCLDVGGALRWVLARIPAGARAIVVDNGSRDGSREVALAHGAFVVDAARRGYGAACAAGLRAATADVVAFCDCDASLDPGDALRLAAAVLDGRADLVVGRRRAVGRGAFPLTARVANLELARRIRRRTGLPIHDLGALRIARRTAVLGLDLQDRRSGYPLELLVRAADAGWRVEEHDVDYHPRVGRSKVTGTPIGAWQAVRDMSAVLAS